MWRFAKAHGTGNDFVLLPDPDGELPLSPDLVAALCNRRRGLGADGVLHVVPAAKHPDAEDIVDQAEWFMDYWNADGSLAEMCGNGVRVFARYLLEEGLVDAEPTGGAPSGEVSFPIATRAGVVRATVHGAAVTVDMTMPIVYGDSTATLAGYPYPGTV